MIRDKSKIFGEQNDPDTVLSKSIMKDGALVLGAGNKGVKVLDLSTVFVPAIIYIDATGSVNVLSTKGQENKVLGVDGNGNLKFVSLE